MNPPIQHASLSSCESVPSQTLVFTLRKQGAPGPGVTSALTRCSAGAPGSCLALPPAAGPCCSKADKNTSVGLQRTRVKVTCAHLRKIKGHVRLWWQRRTRRSTGSTHIGHTRKDQLIRVARSPRRPREDYPRGGGASQVFRLPCQVFRKKRHPCFLPVPVNLQPEASPPGDKQGCRPCEPAHGTEYTKACPRTASARRPTGSGGSLPGTGGFSSARWAAV